MLLPIASLAEAAPPPRPGQSLALRLPAARRLRGVRRARAAAATAEHRQDYDRRRRRIHQGRCGSIPTMPTRASALDRAKLRAVAGPLSARPPPRGDRQVRRGARRVRAGVRAESRRAATSTTSCARRATSCARKVAVAREGKTELQTLIERTRDLPPPGLDLPAGRQDAGVAHVPRREQPRRVHWRSRASPTSASIFDPAFRETPVTVDLRNASLEDALSTVAGATRTFFRVTAPQNRRSSSPTRRPSAASTKKKSSARST